MDHYSKRYHKAQTSSVEGAETRSIKQRLRIGAIILEVTLQHRITLIFPIYFSMVRRRAA